MNSQRFAVAAALCLCLTQALAAQSSAPTNQAEVAAVRAAVDKYLQAHATGDGNHLKDVFHPD